MAGHVVQHMAECRVHAVIALPDVREYWFQRVSHSILPAIVLSPAGSFGFPHHQDGLHDYKYGRRGMHAVEAYVRGG